MAMKIGTRVRLYLGSVFGIVLGLGVFALAAMSALGADVRLSLGGAFEANAAVADLRLLAMQTQLVLAASAAAGTTTDLATVDGLDARFHAVIEHLRGRKAAGIDPDEIAGRMSAMETAGRNLVAANAQQKWTAVGEASPKFAAAAQQLVDILDKAGAAQRQFVTARLEEASTGLRRRAVLFGLGLAITIALALVLLWSLQRQLVDPLKVLTSATARIVETGDLKQSVDLRRDDEIGELAASFSQLVEKLRRIPSSLGDASGLLATCVQNLTVTAEQQTRQAAALQQTQVTANEIKQTSAVAAQKANQLLELVLEAAELGTSGGQSVGRSLNGLDDIAAMMDVYADRMGSLRDQMRQIDNINLAVKDIADQSNMLALNAAIEAVRSGEHGKGFGVVAREIRSLADQSLGHSKRIREVLDEIARSIEKVAALTDKGRTRMNAGAEEIRASGAILSRLAAMVQESSQNARQITASVSQQDAGIGELFASVKELNDTVGKTSEAVASTTSAVGQLQDVTHRVTAIVESYRA